MSVDVYVVTRIECRGGWGVGWRRAKASPQESLILTYVVVGVVVVVGEVVVVAVVEVVALHVVLD